VVATCSATCRKATLVFCEVLTSSLSAGHLVPVHQDSLSLPDHVSALQRADKFSLRCD
jgi:hypothetical protein